MATAIGETVPLDRHTYEDPFLDMAATKLPKSFKKLLELCQIFAMTHPQISPIIQRLAEYPITSLVYKGDEEAERQHKELFEKHLRILEKMIEWGLDYYGYGNCFVSISFPFVRFYRCETCGHDHQVNELKYQYTGGRFNGFCRRCASEREFKPIDQYVQDRGGINIFRFEPQLVTPKYNRVTGKYIYYYDIPPDVRRAVQIGDRDIIDTTPIEYLRCIQLRRKMKIKRVYHFKRPTLSGRDMAWGFPLVLPALKDAYLNQIYKKADECLALTTLVETVDGLVTADDVAVGQLVRTHTGAWKPVVSKWYRDAREEEVGRKITLSCLRHWPSTYSPAHPILSLRRNDEVRRKDTKEKQSSSVMLKNPHLYEESFCPAKEFEVGDYVLYPRNLPSEDAEIDVAAVTGLLATDNFVYSGQFSEATARAHEELESGRRVVHNDAGRAAKRIAREGREPKRMPARRPMTEDMAYILGWYTGDGSCSSRHVNFSLGPDDDIGPLFRAIEREFGYTCQVNESRENLKTLELCNTLVRKLIKGLVPGTAGHKRVPSQVMSATDDIKISYLRGLFEADGHMSDAGATLMTTSPGLAYDVFRMLLHLGCIACVGDHNTPPSTLADGRVIKASRSFPVDVRGPSGRRLKTLFSEGTAAEIEGAEKTGFFWGQYFAARVHGVEESDENEYIDFKVEGDHSFCTPGTATHNCIALEHSVPLRVLYPETRTQDPMQKLALGNFKQFMARNIRYWRRDKNAIITSPMPIGVTNIGGDGAAYSTINARVKVVDEIMGAMMVTRGFVMGGENWSSQNISQRVMENSFLNYLRRVDGCLQWVRDEAAAFLGMPYCGVSMKPFKKIDDVQMLNVIIGLAQQKRVSWEEVLSRMDLDSKAELKIIEEETEHYTKLMLQELMAQNEANAKAIVSQTLAQNEAESIQQFDQDMSQRSDAILAEVQGRATKEEAAQARGQEQAQAAAQDPTTMALQARAEKDSAQAQKDQALAQRHSQQMVDVDLSKQIAIWSGELLRAGPAEKKRLLTALHQDSPEVARAVVEVANQMEGGRQPPDGSAVTRSQDPRSMLMALTEKAKSPQELAQKLMMIEPRQQQQMLLQLSKVNPRLLTQVMKAIQQLNVQQAGAGSVDMRPLPEQKPPRREETPV